MEILNISAKKPMARMLPIIIGLIFAIKSIGYNSYQQISWGALLDKSTSQSTNSQPQELNSIALDANEDLGVRETLVTILSLLQDQITLNENKGNLLGVYANLENASSFHPINLSIDGHDYRLIDPTQANHALNFLIHYLNNPFGSRIRNGRVDVYLNTSLGIDTIREFLASNISGADSNSQQLIQALLNLDSWDTSFRVAYVRGTLSNQLSIILNLEANYQDGRVGIWIPVGGSGSAELSAGPRNPIVSRLVVSDDISDLVLARFIETLGDLNP